MVKLVVVFLSALAVVSANSHRASSIAKIAKINSAQSSWTASLDSHIAKLSSSQFKKLLGAKRPRNLASLPRRAAQANDNIPAEFDARSAWPDCPSISSIKDQGNCGDCWAVSGASCGSDRLCIATGAQVSVNLSAQNLASCCTDCAPDGGCNGGDPYTAWQYIQNTGLVTGGDYDSEEGCIPYEIEPTGSSEPSVSANDDDPPLPTPPCENYCTNEYYDNDYDSDITQGSSAYILPNDVSAIQSDLMKNGPLQASFEVYDDFQYYTSGVYSKSPDAKDTKEGHAIRIIGWGTEGGQDYWLIANSWNKGFGEAGLFKMLRGVNECGIEDYVTAGTFSN